MNTGESPGSMTEGESLRASCLHKTRNCKAEKVYRPEIVNNREKLYKNPGYAM
jgi:hypothetical protein